MSGGSTRCGTVGLAGRPNAGKSTLLNRLVGQKLSITAHRPQTTRHAITGIKTMARAQFIYVDTPGLHPPRGRALNRVLTRVAQGTLQQVDVLLVLFEAGHWTGEDDWVLEQVREATGRRLAVLSKVDVLKERSTLLPQMQRLAASNLFEAVIPVSARRGEGVDALEHEIEIRLPEGSFLYEADALTSASERFLAAEIIREKLTRRLGQELPYALTVHIEKFEDLPGQARILAGIVVEREGQKAIVIGARGAMLKAVGSEARQDMERLFGRRVHLELWVRVRKGWADDEKALRALGYGDDAG
jgi:GTP-binding protein Era